MEVLHQVSPSAHGCLLGSPDQLLRLRLRACTAVRLKEQIDPIGGGSSREGDQPIRQPILHFLLLVILPRTQAVAYEYQTEFAPILAERMQFYGANPQADTINRVKVK